VEERLHNETDLREVVDKSLSMRGFMAFVVGATAEKRACTNDWCTSRAELTEPNASHDVEIEDVNASATKKLKGKGDSGGMGLTSTLMKGDSVVVQGLRRRDGEEFGDLPATVLRARSLQEPDFLLVEIHFPDGDPEERSVPVEVVHLPPGGRKRSRAECGEEHRAKSRPSAAAHVTGDDVTGVVPSADDADDATSIVTFELAGTSTEDTPPDEPPPVDQLLNAKVETLRLWSAANDLASHLRKPLLVVNLCALWHPEELSTITSHLKSLERYESEVEAISAGQLIRSPEARNSKHGETRKEKIGLLRGRYAGERCSQGNLCKMYLEERETARERVASLKVTSDDELNKVGVGLGPRRQTLSQLPITPAECDDILYAMLLAKSRGAFPVHRLTTNLFAVLRTEESSADNSYSTPLGYSMVTVRAGAGGRRLTYQCTCSQYRSVSAPP